MPQNLAGIFVLCSIFIACFHTTVGAKNAKVFLQTHKISTGTSGEKFSTTEINFKNYVLSLGTQKKLYLILEQRKNLMKAQIC